MFRITVLLLFTVLLSACKSTPDLDLSDTKLYLYPQRIFLGEAATDFKFTEKHKAKAKAEMKKQRLDILFEVYLNKDGTLKSIKTVKRSKKLSDKTVIDMKTQLKRKEFFKSFGLNSAFFYAIKIRTEVEFL